jgi:hypothetical protein
MAGFCVVKLLEWAAIIAVLKLMAIMLSPGKGFVAVEYWKIEKTNQITIAIIGLSSAIPSFFASQNYRSAK